MKQQGIFGMWEFLICNCNFSILKNPLCTFLCARDFLRWVLKSSRLDLNYNYQFIELTLKLSMCYSTRILSPIGYLTWYEKVNFFTSWASNLSSHVKLPVFGLTTVALEFNNFTSMSALLEIGY